MKLRHIPDFSGRDSPHDSRATFVTHALHHSEIHLHRCVLRGEQTLIIKLEICFSPHMSAVNGTRLEHWSHSLSSIICPECVELRNQTHFTSMTSVNMQLEMFSSNSTTVGIRLAGPEPLMLSNLLNRTQ